MPGQSRGIERLFYVQLLLFSATWLAGIYSNGFVAILPGTGAESILLDAPIAVHVTLALLTFSSGLVLLALTATSGDRRSTALASLAVVSIAAAGVSGLAFVMGGASDSLESMAMAAGFVTGFFFTFLSVTTWKQPRLQGGGRREKTGSWSAILCALTLALSYCVFVSGIYVNLFVAGPVFSLPLSREPAAFQQAEASGPFVLHELLGGLLLVSLGALLTSLIARPSRRLSVFAALAFLSVAYSAFVGSLNVSSPLSPTPPGILSTLVPMLSAAAFIGSIALVMLLSLRLRLFSPQSPEANPGA